MSSVLTCVRLTRLLCCPTFSRLQRHKIHFSSQQRQSRASGNPYIKGRKRFGKSSKSFSGLKSSNVWNEGSDEGTYDSKSVDDWGVNRDMQQAYKPPLEKEFEACKSSAAGMLAYRPHSSSELRTKLTDKGYDRETIERALHRLQELGLQSDVEYVTIFARSKWRQSRWAPSRIRIELVRKGVSKEDIEAGMRQVFGDEAQKLHVFDDDVSDGAAHDGGESEQRLDQQLLAAAHRQAQLTKGFPSETRRRRLVSWLQRRGHSWETISAILRQLTL